MRTRWLSGLLLILIAVSVAATPIRQVHAEVKGVIHEPGGVSSKNIDTSKSKSVSDPNPVPFSWNGDVGPEKLIVPNGDLYWRRDGWLDWARKYLTPQSVLDRTDDPETYSDQYYTAKAELCVWDLFGEKVAKEINESRIQSDLQKHLNYMRQQMGTLGPELVPFTARDSFVFDENTVIEGIPHNCSSSDKGMEVATKETNVLVKGFYAVLNFIFSLPGEIISFLTNNPDDSTTVESKSHAAVTTKFPRSKYMCHGAQCKTGDVTDEPAVPEAGFANMYQQGGLDYRPEFVHGQIEQEGFKIGGMTKTVQLNYSIFRLFEDGMKFVKCSVMPSDLQNKSSWNNCKATVPSVTPTPGVCDPTWFTEKLTMNKGTSGSGATGDPGYTLPYRNSSCKLDNALLEAAKQVAQGYQGGATANANIDEYADEVQKYSDEYGWNALFVLSLWIEESGAGGHPNAGWHTGCLYGWKNGNAVTMPKIKEGGTICDQMACTFSHPSAKPDDFARFMCSYNTTAIANGKCPDYPNWQFANNLRMVYTGILQRAGRPIDSGACGLSNIKYSL